MPNFGLLWGKKVSLRRAAPGVFFVTARDPEEGSWTAAGVGRVTWERKGRRKRRRRRFQERLESKVAFTVALR